MSRMEWRKILDDQVKRWSSMTFEELLTKLNDLQAYQVEMDSKRYQVEVQLLENSANCILVSVSVDDGRLPASLVPESQTFIKQKD